MAVTAVVVGMCVAIVLLFAVARLVFGRAGAVILVGLVGYCFGGPPGAGVGLVAGLVLIPVVTFLGLLLDPSPEQ
jgi:hypothetical protein